MRETDLFGHLASMAQAGPCCRRRRKRRRRVATIVLGATALGWLVPEASAVISFVYMSQQRNVSISAFYWCNPQQNFSLAEEAPGFTPFIAAVEMSGTSASQQSVLCTNAISASGVADASSASGCVGTAGQNAVSSFSTVVQVPAPKLAELHLSINMPLELGISGKYAIHGPSINIEADWEDIVLNGAPASVDWSGTLLPGQYTIQIETKSAGFGPGSGGFCDYSLSLEVIEPTHAADLDGNGVVNGGDIGVLLANWGGTGGFLGLVDLDCDGVVDGSDLGLLLANWGTSG